jgi:hypothetical protein
MMESAWRPVSRRSFVVMGFLAAGAGLAVNPLLTLVTALGVYIRPHDLAADYITAWFVGILLGAFIMVWPVPLRERLALLAFWVAKLLITLGFMLFYEAYYTSLDSLGYYATAKDPLFDPRNIAWGSGTENAMSLTWLAAQVLPESYHGIKVVWAMMGLVGVYLFYLAGCRVMGKRDLRLFFLLAFTPSILFWSSIVGKDPVTFLGIAMYSYAVIELHYSLKLRYVLIGLAGVAIAAAIRLWMAPIMAVPVVALLLWRQKRTSGRVAIIAIAATSLYFAYPWVRAKLIGESTADLISLAGGISQSWATGGSSQVLAPITSASDFIKFLPLGIFTALFRPLPGEVNNPFGLLAGLENLGLVCLLLLAVRRLRWKLFADPLVIWAVVFVLTWSSVYSLLSYQNLGTAVRFRLQILPVLLLLLLYLALKHKLDPAPSASGVDS